MIRSSCLLGALLPGLLLLGGCRTVHVTEGTLLRPLRDEAASQAASTAALPAPYAAEEHRFATPDGDTLFVLLLQRPDAAQTVLYFGGNMFRISQMGAAALRHLAPLGVNVVFVDHRGYGQSTGAPGSIARLERDALFVYDAVRALPGVEATQVVVHGHSLGSFLAGYVGEQRALDGLVLESSATTGEEWIRYADRRPWYVRPFVRLRVEERLRAAGNLARMPRLDEPLLILVGGEDPVTPPPLSEKLFAHAGVPAPLRRLYVLEGASHNDVPAHPAFAGLYAEFLALVAAQRDAGHPGRGHPGRGGDPAAGTR